MNTKHAPEQQVDANNPSSTDHTTWNYNPDDTILTTIDARGARATFAYNNRGLVTNITYDVLPGVPSTGPAAVLPSSPVSFVYDSAGNRTSLIDSFGCKIYEYDTLSRLKSETRTFTNLSNPNSTDGKFKLAYDYNLGGELLKITDTQGVTINYSYDAVGRLEGMTGSDILVGGYSTYASNIKYRAWGGIKKITEGSSHTTTYGYNSRLKINHFDVSNSVVNQDYDYYNDGRLSTVHNTTDGRFDNSYQYDHAGRISYANSGHISSSVPYSEIFEYDAFNHSTRRITDSWSQEEFLDLATYEKDRRIGWDYDADGRLRTINARNYKYDMAGHNVALTGQVWTGSNYLATQTTLGFDGDGDKIVETRTYPNSVTVYYITSQALGGAVVEELDSSGQKNIGYVYTPQGELVARQGADLVWWKHVSPAGTSEYEVVNSSIGEHINHKEQDPLGASTGLNVPAPRHHPGETIGDLPGGAGGPLDSRSAAIENPGAGCLSVNGNAIPCDWLTRGTLGWLSLTVSFQTKWVHPAWRWEPRIPNPFDPFLPDTITTDTNDVRPGHWESTPLYGTPSVSFSVNQQNTFDLQRIHDLLHQTVTKAPCSTFIRRVLKSVSSADNPLMEGGDLEKLFFNVLNQKRGGFTREPIPGGAGYGSADGRIKVNGRGNAVIFLPEFPVASLRNWSDAQGTIGELMHLAGKNWYLDYDLAVAVNAIPEYAKEYRGLAKDNPFDPSYEGNAKDKNSGGYSSFFHGVQRVICEVPKED